jgi:hypothetical protein
MAFPWFKKCSLLKSSETTESDSTVFPPWIKGTTEGRLYIDTSHPEWIKYFTEFVTKNAGRLKLIMENSHTDKPETAVDHEGRDENNHLKWQVIKLQQENETLNEKLSCALGVGSGDGKLFVHGDYDSIKAAQAIILERDALREQLDKAKEEHFKSLVFISDQGVILGELREQNEKMKESSSDLGVIIDAYSRMDYDDQDILEDRAKVIFKTIQKHLKNIEK